MQKHSVLNLQSDSRRTWYRHQATWNKGLYICFYRVSPSKRKYFEYEALVTISFSGFIGTTIGREMLFRGCGKIIFTSTTP